MNFNDIQKDRLTKAKVSLILDHPFFGTLAARCENTVNEQIPTAQTDGKTIQWNPSFLNGLSDRELTGVLAHEICHIAYGHPWRIDHRDLAGWNVATDKAINEILKESRLDLPDGCLYPNVKERGKSAEEIYAIQPKQNSNEIDPGGCGGVFAPPEDEKSTLAAEWKVAVTQSAAAAKAHGDLPGELARLVDDIVNPKIPWHVVLRDFLQRTARNDYCWSVPNKKYVHLGFALPSLISNELPEVAVVVDTSGSVDNKQIAEFAGEISSILAAFDTTIQVIYADAKVCHTQTLVSADLPLKPLPAKGGGGTDFRPAFKWIEEKHPNVAAIIYLTDGEGYFPGNSDIPTFWVLNQPGTVPFGTAVQL